MKLHSLGIQAFGPFVSRVTVDFDALGSNGVFLLTGDTGAGKSSVLDAVAFAFYGQVPGDRAGAKQLRNHQVDDHVQPMVELEASVGDRRLRISRSPAWARPKKRGQGTTTQQATVSLRVLVDGTWQLLTTRQDEAGQLVSDWLGMTLTQFTQVALLPQGQFQAFLRADSDSRLALLQRLFRTGRHELVERWLREQRLTLSRRERELADVVRERLNRLSEASGLDHPWQEGSDLRLDPRSPLTWAHQVRLDLLELHHTHEFLHTRLAEEAEQARAAALTARDVATLQQQAIGARARLALLTESAEVMDAHREEIARTHRLAVLRPWHTRLVQATQAHDLATRHHEAAVADLNGMLRTTTGTADGQEAARARALIESLGDAVTRAEQAQAGVHSAQQACSAAQTALDQVRPRWEAAREAASALPERRARVAKRLEAAQQASERLPAAAERVSVAEQVLAAVQLRDALAPQLEAAAQVVTEHVDTQLNAKERWLDLRELRITGMAAELAEGLSLGCACPVCGSAEHPVPAEHGTTVVTSADEKAARRLLDDAQAGLQAAQERALELRARLQASSDQAAGTSVAAATTASREASTQERELQGVAQTWTATEAESVQLARQAESVAAEVASLASRVSQREEELLAAQAASAVAAATWESARTELLDLLGHEGSERTSHETLLTMARGHVRAVQRLLEAVDHSVRDTEATRRSLAVLRTGLDDALAEVDFDGSGNTEPEQPSLLHVDDRVPGLLDLTDLSGLGALVASMLDEVALAALVERVRQFDQAVASVNEVLANEDVLAAEEGDPADPQAADRLRQRAAEQADTARVRAAQVARAAHRVRELTHQLDEAVRRWIPVGEESALVDQVAKLADGSSPDNVASMRLSTYVLQRRFAAVIDAANVRLGPMSDARYELEQSGSKLAGERRGGLSLVVTDAWSGVRRDPATLSGGETFVVSLALALGLADVVMAEAGGTVLETLFVDEGFGALDPATLDDVMNTLDGLRSGGRTVGVVSHVPEMRDRITTQLRVHKNRAGSTLEVVGA